MHLQHLCILQYERAIALCQVQQNNMNNYVNGIFDLWLKMDLYAFSCGVLLLLYILPLLKEEPYFFIAWKKGRSLKAWLLHHFYDKFNKIPDSGRNDINWVTWLPKQAVHDFNTFQRRHQIFKEANLRV